MNVIWTWLLSPCRRHRRTLSLIAAGTSQDLSMDHAGARRHLDQCPACQARFRQLQSIARLGTALASQLPAAQPSPLLERRWSAQILAPATAADSPRERLPGLGFWQRRPGSAWSLLAALWALIAFLRLSAPEVAKPRVIQLPLDWRSVSLVLGLHSERPVQKAPDAGKEPPNPPSPTAPAGPLGEYRFFEPARLPQPV